MSRWKIRKSESLFQAGAFRLRKDECELPDGRIMPRYFVIEFSDWVNVVPVTTDGHMLLLKQYRHAAEAEFLEVPGGSTHPGENEEPQKAAERELLEETGHRASEWIYCGFHYPNPALQNNRMHTFVALGCEKVAELSLDPYEDLEVVLVPVREALRTWFDGGMSHSLISASIGLSLKTLQSRGLLPKIF